MKSIKHIIFPMLLSAMLNPLASAYSPTKSRLLMLGGDYVDQKIGLQPLLITSSDAGITWQKAELPAFLPNDRTYKSINDMTCHHSHCFATANSNGDPIQAQLFRSLDNGSTWESVKMNQSPSSQYLFSISCSKKICMAIGSVGNDVLTYSSLDNGVTWSSIPSPLNVALNGTVRINCSGGICNAVGGFYNTTNNQMVTLQSTDGKLWNVINTAPNLPTDSSFSYPVGLYCHHKICVASGTKSGLFGGAIFIYSQDKGLTWHTAQNTDNVDFSKVNLNSMFCDKNKCVAVGSYHSQPIIFTTLDFGMSWKNAPIVNATPINGFGVLFDISCNENSCIAVGNENLNKPYLAKSIDNGLTWNRVTNIANLPDNYFVLSSQSLTCQKQSCFIGGYYAQTSSDGFQSDIISTHDYGNSWQVNLSLNQSLFNMETDSSLYASSQSSSTRGGKAALNLKK